MSGAYSPEAVAVIEGRHADPFRYLGPHVESGRPVLRVFLPDAREVIGDLATTADEYAARAHSRGRLVRRPASGDAGALSAARRALATRSSSWRTPIAFRRSCPTSICICWARATHLQLYDKLGAHPIVHDGVAGVAFAVFAPNARRVSVVGDFNFWDGRRHAMRVRGNGFWEIFVPAVAAGDKYKFEIVGADGECCRSSPIRSRLPPSCGRRRLDRRRRDDDRAAGAGAGRAAMSAMRRSRSTRCISARGGGGPRKATAG